MNRVQQYTLATCCVGLLSLLPVRALAAGYRHFNWQEAAPGVWFGLSTPDDFVGGNVAIITLPGGGSMVVDTQDSEFLGREILEKAKEVGHGPVKYVVNTHLHQDHVGGNIAFVNDNPRVEIIAHENTCKEFAQRTETRMHSRLPDQTRMLAGLRAKRASMTAGTAEANAMDHRIEGMQLYLDDAKDIKWSLPTTCLNLKPGQDKPITVGDRHIEIYYFGRAHTTGDLVVFLPREKVAIVGDLWGVHTGFKFADAGLDGRDGAVIETPLTLERVQRLDFDIALAGHSPVIHGKDSLAEAIKGGIQIIAQIKQGVDGGQSVTGMLDAMPLPDNTPPFFVDMWRNTVINAYEEIQIREQLGMDLLAAQTSHPQ